jgi:hypothetical protein
MQGKALAADKCLNIKLIKCYDNTAQRNSNQRNFGNCDSANMVRR